MRLVLQRKPSQGGATLGTLSIDGQHTCDTLEDEIREMPGQSVADWKIKGSTAIPSGTYPVTLEYSKRFGPNTLTINSVPGFSGIRIHAGNTQADTEGCLLVGMYACGNELRDSRMALALVRASVEQAIGRGESVSIDINNPAADA